MIGGRQWGLRKRGVDGLKVRISTSGLSERRLQRAGDRHPRTVLGTLVSSPYRVTLCNTCILIGREPRGVNACNRERGLFFASVHSVGNLSNHLQATSRSGKGRGGSQYLRAKTV